MSTGQQAWVYVGTYTTKASEGIYVYRLDLPSGALTLGSVTTGIDNPSFLTLHPQGRYLYAVSEISDFNGQPSGGISAFAVDPQTGKLTFLNQQPSCGKGPCYLSVDHTGKYVLVANYVGGNAAILPIEDNGRLGAASDVVQHHGSGTDPRRQKGPHAHSITVDPSNRRAIVADLGLDKLMVYQLDLVQGRLEPNKTPWAQLHAGAGPRHLAFYPGTKYAYVINELDSTMTGFAYDQTSGAFETLQTVSTLPQDFEGISYCADVHISPSGHFVYGSNRGHDSIVVFQIDQDTGKLDYVDHTPTLGKTPRNFCITPSGEWLLVANQDTDTVVTFRINQQTGKLLPTGQIADVPTPVCLKTIVQ
ncbi:MAG: lactonase family protein [Anaerolineae bacterium]|nr:lactonase family protein [Anaerolineae bacterium]